MSAEILVYVVYIVCAKHIILCMIIVLISPHVVRLVGQSKVYLFAQILSNAQLLLCRQSFEVHVVNAS